MEPVSIRIRPDFKFNVNEIEIMGEMNEVKFQVDENAKVYSDGTAVIDGMVSRYINPLFRIQTTVRQ